MKHLVIYEKGTILQQKLCSFFRAKLVNKMKTSIRSKTVDVL